MPSAFGNIASTGIHERLFREFDEYLRNSGYVASKGQIVAATIIQVPHQRNTRDENQAIKAGWQAKDFQDWSSNKQRQKDTDARWKQKNGKSYFGYENHVQVNVGNKFIRDFQVTDASVHDSQIFTDILDSRNTGKKVYADSACCSQASLERLKELVGSEAFNRKATKDKPLSSEEKEKNRQRSCYRCRVEHVFTDEAQMMGNRLVRVIVIVGAKCVLCYRNLEYNICRFAFLQTMKQKSASRIA